MRGAPLSRRWMRRPACFGLQSAPAHAPSCHRRCHGQATRRPPSPTRARAFRQARRPYLFHRPRGPAPEAGSLGAKASLLPEKPTWRPGRMSRLPGGPAEGQATVNPAPTPAACPPHLRLSRFIRLPTRAVAVAVAVAFPSIGLARWHPRRCSLWDCSKTAATTRRWCRCPSGSPISFTACGSTRT